MCGNALKKSNKADTAREATECAGIMQLISTQDLLLIHLRAWIRDTVSNSSTFCTIWRPGTKPLWRSDVPETVTGAKLAQVVALIDLLSVHRSPRGLVSAGDLTTTLEPMGSEGRGFLGGKCHNE